LRHALLPATTLGLASAALIARLTRSALLEILGQDYVRTARSKGLRECAVIARHALRNALVPIITVVGIDLGRMLAGTTVVEILFSRPGIGHLLINALKTRDYPLIQGAIVFYVAVIILVNTFVDVLYSVVDPRIRNA
jgi:ABC-type dipeptide/oligopeptide/nickel transport system permease component